MDCPNCGVYNPEERTICWRCDQKLPKPEEPKRRQKDPATTMRRAWILIFVVLVIWIVMTWLLPMLLGNGSAPVP